MENQLFLHSRTINGINDDIRHLITLGVEHV